ncbi:sigma-70 family RNA polymerase sigma factor [Blastopirellula sp. J2-11]|uniref:sigma-70 family RNA polymerase sigma factor n=1 Tax=Blastopirellula sp. J2-11 TaxID=2943192 RepID=UPI0021CA0E5C|nr:sigma-70 family RNA polymerase sigma factor [Blastopirellula sp. J2-11]UUO04343.1 sigma-70 family RNA polymerase sigma factor [Blastopirellula sp. J2-11]
MTGDQTTMAVQQYLHELAQMQGRSMAEPVIRDLIARSVQRLHMLCQSMLVRSYPRLMQPPLNLQADEMLSSVVDRLMKAMREVRPDNVRQFFALANQHMRWELNDLARRLDNNALAVELNEAFVAAPESSGSQLSVTAVRILTAIDDLPEAEREVFSLVRIQGMQQTEAAEILDVSTKTVQRRLNRAIMMLSEILNDLDPGAAPTE